MIEMLGQLLEAALCMSLLLAVVDLANAQSPRLVFIGQSENQITLECRDTNSSPLPSPQFWVERLDFPRQPVNSGSPRNGQITFMITQVLEGMYSCSNNDVFSNKLEFVAYPHPNFTVPSSYVFEVGQPATIHCRIMPGELRQYYSVSWMSGSLTIATSNSQSEDVLPGYQLHDNFSLTIQNIQPRDSNTSYVCKVTIDNPQISGNVNKQYGQQQLGSYTVFVYVPPSVATPMEPRVVASEQGSTTFVCHATGIPTPQISWIHNGQNISIRGDERFQSSIIERSGNSIRSRLNAAQLRVRDSGSIDCVAHSIVDGPNGQQLPLLAFSNTTLSVLTHDYDPVIRVASGDLFIQINFDDSFRILEQVRLLMKFTDEKSMRTTNMTSLQAFVNASTICLEVSQSRVPFQQFRVQVALKVRDEVGQFVPRDSSRVYDITERSEETRRTGIIAGSVVGVVILIACVLALPICCAYIMKLQKNKSTKDIAAQALEHDKELMQSMLNKTPAEIEERLKIFTEQVKKQLGICGFRKTTRSDGGEVGEVDEDAKKKQLLIGFIKDLCELTSCSSSDER